MASVLWSSPGEGSGCHRQVLQGWRSDKASIPGRRQLRSLWTSSAWSPWPTIQMLSRHGGRAYRMFHGRPWLLPILPGSTAGNHMSGLSHPGCLTGQWKGRAGKRALLTLLGSERPLQLTRQRRVVYFSSLEVCQAWGRAGRLSAPFSHSYTSTCRTQGTAPASQARLTLQQAGLCHPQHRFLPQCQLS